MGERGGLERFEVGGGWRDKPSNIPSSGLMCLLHFVTEDPKADVQ